MVWNDLCYSSEEILTRTRPWLAQLLKEAPFERKREQGWQAQYLAHVVLGEAGWAVAFALPVTPKFY